MILKRNFVRIPIILFLLTGISVGVSYCGANSSKGNTGIDSTKKLLYLNHADSVKYVGMDACRKCHENIYATFMHTGMGASFDLATFKKSAAKFKKFGTKKLN